MSDHKWGCIVRKCENGEWIVADSTEAAWLGSDLKWYPSVHHADFYLIGIFAGKDRAVHALYRCTTPPPTYAAPLIEVKPLPDEADRHFKQAIEAFNKLKELYDVVVAQRDAAIADRDAARAELAKKEEGK